MHAETNIDELIEMADFTGIKYEVDGEGDERVVEFFDSLHFNVAGEMLAANSSGNLMEYMHTQLSEAVYNKLERLYKAQNVLPPSQDEKDLLAFAAGL